MAIIRKGSTAARQATFLAVMMAAGAIAIFAMATRLACAGEGAGGAAAVQESVPLASEQIPQNIKDAVSASDRPAADRSLDAGRKPEQMLAFFGIQPGMKVADLFAGGGYTTQLLSRAVGPNGTVYSQNPIFPPQFQNIEQSRQKRLKNPALKNVVSVSKASDDPGLLPAAPGSLDAVVTNMNYHDQVLFGVDRDKMNAAVYKALKPGGVYGIVDHSAKAGSGLTDVGLHRIDESVVINEVQKAGFKLDAASSALRHPEDDRTWSASPRASGARRGTTDRFMLKFVKP